MAESSSSHVISDLSSPPTIPINNGKRGAEEDVELQVYKKKHKKTEEQNKATPVNVAVTTQDANESMQEDDNTSPNKSVRAPSVNVAATTHDANESMREDENEDDNDNTSPKKSVRVEAAPVAETTQDDAERSSISNEYEEDHQHLESPKTSVSTICIFIITFQTIFNFTFRKIMVGKFSFVMASSYENAVFSYEMVFS
ncbi:uncharacterized protein LOC143607414 isoform X1 [Bidens hawaiensis]|uniref:uncharacterized protein LOC143607414 isoform X1 n=1 Tax=Bidens hawaiensis TaxID=980011 RepID=UPI00404908D4